jgi:class 3 adenylate cyclase
MGYGLGGGMGIAQGFATIGTIGFPGRHDYGVIGAVNNLAARLCAHAEPGQILISQRVFGRVDSQVVAESIGALPLKGINAPVPAFNVVSRRTEKEAAE